MNSRILDPAQETLKYLRQKGRLSMWAKTIATQQLQRGAEDQTRNLEAQSAAVRRQLYGENQATGDDMGDTYLGDVQITHQLPQQPQQRQQGGGLLVPILCAALGTLGPAGAVGGYLLSRWADQVPAQQTAAPVASEPIIQTITEPGEISIDLGKIPGSR